MLKYIPLKHVVCASCIRKYTCASPLISPSYTRTHTNYGWRLSSFRCPQQSLSDVVAVLFPDQCHVTLSIRTDTCLCTVNKRDKPIGKKSERMSTDSVNGLWETFVWARVRGVEQKKLGRKIVQLGCRRVDTSTQSAVLSVSNPGREFMSSGQHWLNAISPTIAKHHFRCSLATLRNPLSNNSLCSNEKQLFGK